MPDPRMTEGEYLAYDLTHEGRHEYYPPGALVSDGSWRLTEAEGEGTVAIPPHGLALSLSEVYEGVELGRP